MYEGRGSRMICSEWLKWSPEISEIDRKITHNVKPKIFPEGPAKERNRRRVLRTTWKKLFIMRRCAVKHIISLKFSSENSVSHGILNFHENLDCQCLYRLNFFLDIFKWIRRISKINVYIEIHRTKGKSDFNQNYDIGTSEIQKNVPRSCEIS